VAVAVVAEVDAVAVADAETAAVDVVADYGTSGCCCLRAGRTSVVAVAAYGEADLDSGVYDSVEVPEGGNSGLLGPGF